MSKSKRKSKPKANATEVWYECMENMSTDEQYQYMQEHAIHTDCTFVVGPEEGETREFKSHRLHMARVSPVFEAMLLQVEAKTGHFRITDLSPKTFQLLLSFIYGKELKTSFHEARDLAFVAHKYQIKKLLETCVTRISTLITPENIWTVFNKADLLQNDLLKKTYIQVLQCDTLRCITNTTFMQASEENVALLLEQDELNVDDELLLVNSIVHWARHTARQRGLSDDDSGVRAVLEPRLLSLFRLLAMSPQQFMLGPGLAGWLTKHEKDAISECLRSRNFGKWPQHLSTVVEKRRIVTGVASTGQIEVKKPSGQFICKREITSSRPHLQLGVHICGVLIFRVTSSCNWLGFQCLSRFRTDPTTDSTALSSKNPTYLEDFYAKAYTFNRTLSTDFTKIQISSTHVNFRKHTEYNSTISVMFDKPVHLCADSWFAIEVVFQQNGMLKLYDKTPKEYRNPLRVRSVYTSAGVEFVFRTEKQEGFYTSTNDGLIDALIFSL